jgi:hypothetical protein
MTVNRLVCIGVYRQHARALLPGAEVRLAAQSLCAGNPHAFALRELFAERVSARGDRGASPNVRLIGESRAGWMASTHR